MEIKISKNIHASPERTFGVFSDITKAREHIDGIIKVEILSETSVGLGTCWRETRMMFGREATEEMKITEQLLPTLRHRL